MADSWTSRHFSLSNAATDDVTDLPQLLRRVATEIEDRQIGPMDLLDVTIHSDITDVGPWWAVTVHWDDSESTDAWRDRRLLQLVRRE